MATIAAHATASQSAARTGGAAAGASKTPAGIDAPFAALLSEAHDTGAAEAQHHLAHAAEDAQPSISSKRTSDLLNGSASLTLVPKTKSGSATKALNAQSVADAHAATHTQTVTASAAANAAGAPPCSRRTSDGSAHKHADVLNARARGAATSTTASGAAAAATVPHAGSTTATVGSTKPTLAAAPPAEKAEAGKSGAHRSDQATAARSAERAAANAPPPKASHATGDTKDGGKSEPQIETKYVAAGTQPGAMAAWGHATSNKSRGHDINAQPQPTGTSPHGKVSPGKPAKTGGPPKQATPNNGAPHAVSAMAVPAPQPASGPHPTPSTAPERATAAAKHAAGQPALRQARLPTTQPIGPSGPSQPAEGAHGQRSNAPATSSALQDAHQATTKPAAQGQAGSPGHAALQPSDVAARLTSLGEAVAGLGAKPAKPPAKTAPAKPASSPPAGAPRGDTGKTNTAQAYHGVQTQAHNTHAEAAAKPAAPQPIQIAQTSGPAAPADPSAGAQAAAAAQTAPGHVAASLQVAPQPPGAPAQQPVPLADLGTVAINIAAQSKNGAKQFSIALHPADLGSIQVQLSVNHAGAAQAHLSAANPQTLQLLQSNAHMLERGLREAGVNLTGGGLNFSLKGQQQQNTGGHAGRSNGRSLSVSAIAGAAAAVTETSTYSLTPGSVRLDIRV